KVADDITGSKGVDLNEDIHKTLQDGLESIRADIHQLRESIHDEKSEAQRNTSIVPLDLVRRDHVDDLKALVTESQINAQDIDVISLSPSEPTKESFLKSELEDMMKNIQNSIILLTEQSQGLKEECIGKEELEAIENVVRNTNARFDDVDFKQFINKEDLNPLELLIGGTQDDLGNLAVHLEDVSKKDDIGVVESITRDILINIESLKDLLIKTAENPEVTKMDISAVESICSEVKCIVDKMLTTEISSLASKEDFQNLEAQVKEFKEQINEYAKNNAKLSDDRHLQVVDVSETLAVIQDSLKDFEDTVKKNIGDNAKSTESLGVSLEEFSKILTRNVNVSEDVKLLSDVVKEEFEKSTATIVGSKLEQDEKFQQICDKFDDTFEKRFGDLLNKFDDTRVITEGASKLSEGKMNQIETTLNETQIATEDLKLLAGHLNSSLTESHLMLDKSSQLITDRVDETNARLKQVHIDTKIEHQQTRENINKIFCMIEGIDSTLKENSPKITESLRDLCLITNKQHEDSRISISTLEEKICERILRFESPNLLLPPPPPSNENLIDSSAHEKLDKLVNGMNMASKSFSQLDMLEKIHQQVIKTAAEVKEYFSTQTKQIYDDYEEKKRATEEVSSILERKIAQKESAEDTVISLRREEEQLRSSISDLKVEHEGLTRKKTRLHAEVAGLETALKIRREELDIMEERAGSLERRILESVIDQSRTLLISETNKGREAMNRKRVRSHNGSVHSPTISKSTYMSQIAVEMVKKGNRSAKKNSQNNSRRILSLSQITDNASPGSLNRCHSVKTPSGILRKNSWGGTISLNYDHLNEKNLRIKDNEDVITEHDPNFYDDVLSSNSGGVILPMSAGSRVSEIITEDGTTGSLERSDGDIDILSEIVTPVTAEIEPTDTFVVL
ncbi:putative chromosome segregation atpase family protein, partial [Erysiphe neolycopersici]